MTTSKKKDPKKLPGPCSHRQKLYMVSDANVTLYGGAAGGGKSEVGVIDFLQYTDIPGFVGVITRKTHKQMEGPGGVLSKCKRIFGQAYEPHEFVWRAKDGKFVFHKSGAEIYLRHFQHEDDKENWQGSEANLYYIDEATQFSQEKVQYIMSRMRNPSCPQVQPMLKMTCNPDADHFLRKFVEPYLHEDGTPDRSKDGLIRYFAFHDGGFVFGDTREDLMFRYGLEEEDTLSFKFISANVNDNPVLQAVNPKYVSWLRGLKGVERKRLLDGNWHVRESASGYFKREWLTPVKYHEQEFVSFCRAWDIAGTLPSESNPNPDWTAGVLIGKTKLGRYVICDVVRFRARYGEVIQRIIEVGKADPSGTLIRLPQEPGQAGKAAGQMMVKSLVENGLGARLMTTNQRKVDRFMPFASAAEVGLVDYCDDGDWVEHYLYELEAFDGTRKCRDDQVDATSDAFITLAKGTPIPDFLSGMVEANASLAATNPFH